MRKFFCTGFALAFLLALLAVPVSADEEMSGFARDVVANLDFTVGRVVELAEATPADQFGWRPNEEVRTVSEVYMHLVGVSLLLPSFMGAELPEGVELPAQEDGGPFSLLGKWEAEVTEKEAVIAKLKASLEYAKAAIPTITDLETEVQLFGPQPQSKRAYIMILMSHAHEHLGQSIAYARSMGVVPPWSVPQDAGADGDYDDAGEAEGDSEEDSDADA